LHRYSDYKPSVTHWFEKAPSHWIETKNKYVFRSVKSVVGEEWRQYDLLTMGKRGVRLRDMEAGGKFPESFETYQSVKPNQLIFCLFDLDETPRTVGISDQSGMITSAYDVFECFDHVDAKFINYYYQCIDDFKGLRPYYTGLRKVVRHGTFMSIPVYLPPLPEQTEIANYLDGKQTQIDSLIEKIERKIELLKEQRTASINQAVTKGLDHTVEIKGSGIEWIGEIPKHWEVNRLISLGEFSKGKGITKDNLTDQGKPCVLYSELYTKYERIISQNISFIDTNLFELSVTVNKGTFLFTSSGETSEEIGKCVLIDTEYELAAGGDLVLYKLLHPNYFDAHFLSFVFNSHYHQSQKSSNSRGEIVVHIYEKQLRDLRIAYPDVGEQQKISSYLIREEARINNVIGKETKRIGLLKEYRQSLISNVVTGKVRVVEDVA